jgi:putative transposase
MARRLRVEFNGALYHVTSRGNARENIFDEDGNRNVFLEILGKVVNRFNWIFPASA